MFMIKMPAMSLKSTVRAAIISVAIGSVITIIATVSAYSVLTRGQNDRAYASAVSANVARLNLLTSEILMRPSARAVWQLKRQHEILSAQLAQPRQFNNRADILAAELGRRVAKMKVLIEYVEKLTASTPSQALAQDARDILFTALIGQSGALHSRSLEMREVIAGEAVRVQRNLFIMFGGSFVAAMVIGGALLLLLCYRLLARILQLRSVIQEIGGGKLDADIPAPTHDEMGDVFRELDQMRLSLLASIGELGRVNLELIRAKADLEDRVADRTASLELANRELESFTYAVSHDLRAPLRSISGFSQAVLEDYGDKLDEHGRTMLHRVTRGTASMGRLIDDLLKISRIDRSPPVLTDVNLSEIAAGVWEALRESAPDRDVRMTIEPEVRAQCDGRLVAIVLTNLLENAWKFTARTPQAEIIFGQQQDIGRTTYFVRDNGAGFEMAYSEKLFQPFQRLHSAEEFPGTGIGLATVARIVRAHGGKIWATSEPGKGAKFCFQLGVVASRAAPDASAREEPAAPPGNPIATLARAG